jgi:hypothetical protein
MESVSVRKRAVSRQFSAFSFQPERLVDSEKKLLTKP